MEIKTDCNDLMTWPSEIIDATLWAIDIGFDDIKSRMAERAKLLQDCEHMSAELHQQLLRAIDHDIRKNDELTQAKCALIAIQGAQKIMELSVKEKHIAKCSSDES